MADDDDTARDLDERAERLCSAIERAVEEFFEFEQDEDSKNKLQKEALLELYLVVADFVGSDCQKQVTRFDLPRLISQVIAAAARVDGSRSAAHTH